MQRLNHELKELKSSGCKRENIVIGTMIVGMFLAIGVVLSFEGTAVDGCIFGCHCIFDKAMEDDENWVKINGYMGVRIIPVLRRVLLAVMLLLGCICACGWY